MYNKLKISTYDHLRYIKNLYTQRDTATKQRIIGSIFPRKMVFEKNSVRTLEVNRVVSLILNACNTSGGGKKEKHTDFGVLSCGVVSTDLFSNPFLEDLEMLNNLLK